MPALASSGVAFIIWSNEAMGARYRTRNFFMAVSFSDDELWVYAARPATRKRRTGVSQGRERRYCAEAPPPRRCRRGDRLHLGGGRRPCCSGCSPSACSWCCWPHTRLGYRVGRRATRVGDQTRNAHAQTWETEVLGLLALLVGFSFGMAVDALRCPPAADRRRGERHRHHLPAHPVPARAGGAAAARPGAATYVDVRLEYYDAAADRARVLADGQRSAELQAQIWSLVVAGPAPTRGPPPRRCWWSRPTR